MTYSTTLKQYYSPFPNDIVFGSIKTSFQHKWKGHKYAHPHMENEAQQTLHWARLAAENDPNTITLLVHHT